MNAVMHHEISFYDNPPQLIIIVGPCRTGTTGLSNNFIYAGVTSYMQPIKSMRRAMERDNEIVPWEIYPEELALTKETIGPGTLAEFLDPVEILLDLDYPKEKLVLIPIVRDPVQTYASWKRMWGVVNFQKFVQSYELILEIKNNTHDKGIKTIPYIHEIIKDHQASMIIPKLFAECGLSTTGSSNIVKGWGEFKNNKPNVYFYGDGDPPKKFIDGIEKRGGYKFGTLPVKIDDALLIQDTPALKTIYEEFRNSCMHTFGASQQ